MPKGISQLKRSVVLVNNDTPTIASSDTVTADVDMGTSRNGYLTLAIAAAANPLEDVILGTSDESDAFTTGTEIPADDRATLVIMTNDSSSGVSVANNKISFTSSDAGYYVFDAKYLKRYATLQYTAIASDTVFTAELMGLDLADAPYKDGASNYSKLDGGVVST